MLVLLDSVLPTLSFASAHIVYSSSTCSISYFWILCYKYDMFSKICTPNVITVPTPLCKRGWVIPPPTPLPSPPAVSARNWTKYNKSLKDPVRRAGSTQVQIRSYRNRQSGNLARKVRNAFPGLTALRLGSLYSNYIHR